MKRIRQTRARNCGQTCLAMISGFSVESVERLMGKVGGTQTKDLVRWLRSRGFECPARLKIGAPTGIAICKVPLYRRNGTRMGNWHWVVFDGARYLDPSDGEALRLSHVSSHLPVKCGEPG